MLGYLLGGAIIGPYALGLISDVHSIKHLAEIGVVLLLFNIGGRGGGGRGGRGGLLGVLLGVLAAFP